MGGAGYELLGRLVWKGGRLYARRRYRRFGRSRRAVLGGLLGLVAAGAVIAAARARGDRSAS